MFILYFMSNVFIFSLMEWLIVDFKYVPKRPVITGVGFCCSFVRGADPERLKVVSTRNWHQFNAQNICIHPEIKCSGLHFQSRTDSFNSLLDCLYLCNEPHLVPSVPLQHILCYKNMKKVKLDSNSSCLTTIKNFDKLNRIVTNEKTAALNLELKSSLGKHLDRNKWVSSKAHDLFFPFVYLQDTVARCHTMKTREVSPDLSHKTLQIHMRHDCSSIYPTLQHQ